jgi:putative acetyltransferase
MTGTDRIHVRREKSGDEAAIARVNREAFGKPDEARIVDAIRQAGPRRISLVAVDGAAVVGHILFTPIALESEGSSLNVMGLAPMSVLPEFQRRGIGSMLVKAGLCECREAGCQLVVVIGHPEFYPRFGFRPARGYGLQSEFDVPDEAFMVAELMPGALAECRGLVRYLREFGPL